MVASFHHRLLSLVLLLAYAVSGTSILPAMVSAVAWVDGSHSVVVKQSEQGLQVFLQHQSERYTPRLEDHKTALARILVSMCESADSGDHQMSTGQITAGTSLRTEAEQRIEKVPVLNFQETRCLNFASLWPSLHQLCDLLKIERGAQRVSLQSVLATVRLLI